MAGKVQRQNGGRRSKKKIKVRRYTARTSAAIKNVAFPDPR